MHIHILGICGTFMGGIAQLAQAAGHRVTGCDSGVYPPMSTQLEASGIELVEGYGIEQLALKPDFFLVGNAISRGNPLLEEITLVVFFAFSIVAFKQETFRWNHALAAVFLVAAVWLVFKK